jgi:hypothetical protein
LFERGKREKRGFTPLKRPVFQNLPSISLIYKREPFDRLRVNGREKGVVRREGFILKFNLKGASPSQ